MTFTVSKNALLAGVGDYPAIIEHTSGDTTGGPGSSMSCDVRRAEGLTFSMVSAPGMTSCSFAFEGSIDSTDGIDGTWKAANVLRSNAATWETTSGVLTAVPAYHWIFPCAGLHWFRVRVLTIVGGDANFVFSPAVQASVTPPGISSVYIAVGSWVGVSAFYRLLSAASTNLTVARNSGCSINTLTLHNISASVRYLKIYNKAVTPVLASDTPVMTIALPASSMVHMPFPSALRLSNGLALAITGGVADTDTTAIGANEVIVNASYA